MSFSRVILNAFIAASVAVGPFARAQQASPSAIVTAEPAAVGQEIVAGPAKAKMQSSMRTAILFRPFEVSVSVGHGLLFIMTAVGIEMVVHDIQKQGLTWETAGPARLAEVAQKVSVEIVNNGQVLTALAGAGALATVAKEPVEAMTRVLVDAEAKATLAKCLSRSILSTVGFLGWEFGAQLWTQASYMIKDTDDFNRLNHVFGIAGGSLRSLLRWNPSESDARDLRIASTMLSNMITILFLDSNLLAKWHNDSWRLRVLTGDAALLMALTAAGVATGVAVLPAGGMMAGIIFGYVAWKAVPQRYKDEGTFLFRSMRASLAAGQLYANESEIRGMLSRSLRPGVLSLPERAKALTQQFVDRSKSRSSFVLAQIDRMHLALKILRREGSSAEEKMKARVQIQDGLGEINRMYEQELKTCELLIRYKAAAELQVGIATEQLKARELSNFWTAIGSEIRERLTSDIDGKIDISRDDVGKKLVDFIDGLHIEGFREELVLLD